MKKKMLWKDIVKSVAKSKGRFFSIMGLMFLGSFALVGLKVTGPDMRATSNQYTDRLNTADITVISPLGLDTKDVKTLNQTKGTKEIDYGYLKDVVIKGSTESIRLFSEGAQLSGYQVVTGRLPEKNGEIALDEMHQGKYRVGETIKFTEKADASGSKILKEQEFKIVGFVYSSEILSSLNMGQSTAGSGELKGYGVVPKATFDSPYYMLARMSFKDTAAMDPYSQEYTDKIQAHKDALTGLLKDQPAIRLATIKKDYQTQIDEGQQKIADAKQQLADAREQLLSGEQKITSGTQELTTAKATLADGEKQLAAASEALNSGKTTLAEKWQQLENGKQQLANARDTLDAAANQLAGAATAIANGQGQLATGKQQLDIKAQELAAGQKEYETKKEQLAQAQQKYQDAQKKYADAKSQLDQNQQKLTAGKTQYENGLAELKQGIAQADAGISQLKQQIAAIDKQLGQAGLSDEEIAKLTAQKNTLTEKLTGTTTTREQLASKQKQTQSDYEEFIKGTYDPGMEKINAGRKELAGQKTALDQAAAQITSSQTQLQAAGNKLANGQKQLTAGKQALTANQATLAEKEAQYQAARNQYNSGTAAYNENQQTYYAGMQEWLLGVQTLDEKSAEYTANAEKIATAKKELAQKDQELSAAKDQLTDKQKEYAAKEPDALKKIKENEDKLNDAQETLDHLKAPVYSLNSRREIPGSEGAKTYSTISRIVDALANVFPIFLYFVAALVTSTTMTRFVDEERINSGTLKALGYSNRDVLKKFTFYGLVSSLLGTIIGVVLGHVLLPQIVFNAYHDGFVFQNIQLHVDPLVTIVALLLAVVSSVVPAWLVAHNELQTQPAALLLPKPPTAGSKILLERIGFIWRKMSFTHKVTARNIFRYKKRMLMTIFGVAGAVALLFAGFSVQHSIGGISDRQFGEIIHYDMIVAENETVLANQQTALSEQLAQKAVKEYAGIHFETMTKVAGDNQDTQEIKLLVPNEAADFKNYVTLANRKTGEKIPLPDDGVIISERLAKLLKVKAGDTITLKDENDQPRKMKVSGITEMYMGHFAFTSKAGYQKIFKQDYQTNAYIINLKNNSLRNTEKQAAKFMDLGGVKGVVQNTTLIDQVHAIVNSLNKIMKVLIVIAGLLGIVILYNLTNINVSERIRELSTIKVLGFYDKEVTMYIYRETILLTLIGIVTGFGVGELLHQYIITVVPPDEVMFNPALGVTSFLVPTLIIGVVTFVLGLVINHRLKHVDMLEALKSVD